MKKIPFQPVVAIAAGLALLLLCARLQAQDSDPDWPCVQALVPEVALAVLWPQPPEQASEEWRNDRGIAELAGLLGDLESFDEDHRQLIEDFVAAQPQQTLPDSLTSLAEGVLSVANQRRSRYISGIKRYTRQQIAMAAQIEEQLNNLETLDDPAQNPDRTQIEESLHWQERIFDQRERAIIALCERPVALEETLSSVMRQLAQYLP